MPLATAHLPSPVGPLTLAASDHGLVAILWTDTTRVLLGETRDDSAHPILAETRRQLGQYFTGARTRFDLPLRFIGTDFQKQVWAALLDIPYGETRSYAEIARAIGRTGASRAVGTANGRNPLSIVAPCHRVIGTSGALTGFAGGMDAKRILLDLERGQLSLAA